MSKLVGRCKFMIYHRSIIKNKTLILQNKSTEFSKFLYKKEKIEYGKLHL